MDIIQYPKSVNFDSFTKANHNPDVFGASRFRVGKLLLGIQIKSAQVEHDRVTEALTIAVTAGLRLDLLDLRVHRFAQGIGRLQHNRVDDAV